LHYIKQMSKAENTRQYIIEKSAPLFNTKGVAGTAVTDIIKATKMARGALYFHFANLEELTHSVVDYNLRMFEDRTMAVANKQTSAKDKFFALLDYLSDPLNPPVQGGCPMMNFGMEADDTSPVIRERVHQTMCNVQQAMVDFVELGIAAGEFKKNWNAKNFSTKAYAMVEGGILISRLSVDITQMKLIVEMLKAEIEDNCVENKILRA
jgi:TetR/AcrR family transcriptional repressor of nem operon